MLYEKYEHITTEQKNRILTLTLDRPSSLNAVNNGLHEELGDIFYDVAKDEGVDVIVLTGAGRAFCAGGDLAEVKQNLDGGNWNYLKRETAKRIIFSLLELEKPIIARINGPCMGLGATLALFCDLIYMADDTFIGDPHVCAGVVAGDGAAIIWPQLIGYARAKEYLMTGDPISAKDAASMGLINYAVPMETLDDQVYGMAERLEKGAGDAIRWTKTSVNIGLKQLAHSILDTSLAYEWLTFQAPEHKEAVTAFTEKREPRFERK